MLLFACVTGRSELNKKFLAGPKLGKVRHAVIFGRAVQEKSIPKSGAEKLKIFGRAVQ